MIGEMLPADPAYKRFEIATKAGVCEKGSSCIRKHVHENWTSKGLTG